MPETKIQWKICKKLNSPSLQNSNFQKTSEEKLLVDCMHIQRNIIIWNLLFIYLFLIEMWYCLLFAQNMNKRKNPLILHTHYVKILSHVYFLQELSSSLSFSFELLINFLSRVHWLMNILFLYFTISILHEFK